MVLKRDGVLAATMRVPFATVEMGTRDEEVVMPAAAAITSLTNVKDNSWRALGGLSQGNP